MSIQWKMERKQTLTLSRQFVLNAIREHAAKAPHVPVLAMQSIPSQSKDVTMELGPAGFTVVWRREDNTDGE